MSAIVSAVAFEDEVLVPPDGYVTLEDKTIPVTEQIARDQLHPDANPLVFTRGRVDVGPLQALLDTKAPDIWTEEEHARSNVKLTRPAHDRWGISKIVFVFSDDFLKTVYTFPWFRDPEWREALQPVFDVLGIPEHRLIRCLLASMPPGCIIPVHHDTGHWVRHTHRIHVAVTTNVAEVDFFVGPEVDKLRKVSLDEGRVVELNNQAKHAVTNRWSKDRVHLILDYVEDYPLRITELSVGARLAQTRRSIDVAGEVQREGSAVAFIVIGGQKCGTSMLYECLNQHPLVVRGRRRETHFFDWRWQDALETVESQREFYMNFFHSQILEQHPSLVTGESTPSYLLRGDIVIPRLKAVSGDTALFVMLRDPVTRAYSQYQMAVDPEGTPAQLRSRGGGGWRGKSFEEVVSAEEASLSKAGITPETSPQEFARDYLSTRPSGFGGHSLLARGLYALQLQPWLEAFDSRQIKVLFLEEMVQDDDTLQTTMDSVFEHVGLPPSPVEDRTPKNKRQYAPMDLQMEIRLRRFYEPYDEALRQLLGRNSLPWSGGSD